LFGHQLPFGIAHHQAHDVFSGMHRKTALHRDAGAEAPLKPVVEKPHFHGVLLPLFELE
jgi:hypothetical protein